jgi:lauroyl/myristoyl acyltransferase
VATPDASARVVRAYAGVSRLVQTLPRWCSALLAAIAGPVAFVAAAGRRRMLARHLRRVDPALGGVRLWWTTLRAFQSYARYYAESFRLPALTSEEVDRPFRPEGYEHVLAALARGNGAVLALPHLGGWEWAGRWVADRGHPITVVVEPLEPPELFAWFAALREDLGMEVVPLGPDVATRCLAALKRNAIVCLPSDRDLTGDGVPVTFFGESTTLPAGPALLALRSGAPLLPIGVFQHGWRDRHWARVLPPLDTTRRAGLRADVARITQDLADAYESLIRAAPEQWHLMQPNWPSDRVA